MKISDFDIYHLPPLMGMFVDYIENECERLLQESPQFTELQREDHELLDEYPFLNMITDSNGVTKALDLNYAETEALARFCLVEDDINCWKRLQMYLLGIAYAMEIIELLKLDYQKHGACIGEETMLICYKQTEEKEDTEKERGDIMAENNTKELDFDRKHEEDLQRLRGLRLLDDDFMQKVFEDKACTEFLLQIILNRTDLKVLRVNGQQDIKNLQGRSVRLDILAVDAENRVYNIEIQRSDKGAGVKRARYNSSLIDANVTEPGEKYENFCLNNSIKEMRTKYVDLLQKEFNFKMLKPGKNKYKLKRVTASSNISMGYWHLLSRSALRQDDMLVDSLIHGRDVKAVRKSFESMRSEEDWRASQLLVERDMFPENRRVKKEYEDFFRNRD